METKWSSELMKYIKETNGAMVRPLTGNQYDPNGWPDKLIVLSTGMFLVEFKGPKTTVTPGQKEVLKNLHKRQPSQVLICRQEEKGGCFYRPGEENGKWKEISLCSFKTKENFLSALLYAANLIASHERKKKSFF